jgi:hypothetical protein
MRGQTTNGLRSVWIEDRDKWNIQLFQCRRNVRELEKDGPVWDFLVVKHEADLPYHRREADILGASQVI